MMQSASRLLAGLAFAALTTLALPRLGHAQQALPAAAIPAATVPASADGQASAHPENASLPNAPDAAAPAAASEGAQAQTASPASSDAQTAVPPTAPSQNAPSQNAPSQTDAQKAAQQTAEDQLKAQEKQRVMGVMATFNTTSNRNALPLSPKQKFQLFFKSETDPWPFMLAAVVAGIGQADDSYPAWGQGMQGYGKRIGAAYTDAFIGNFFGNALLPSLIHEDPRYFQKGTGSFTRRALWAASSTVWCRRDNGSWGPNYANVGGNLIGAAIARVYYPASERTVGNTISDGLTVSAEGIVGAEVIEFWPDIARHYKRKHAEKLARQAAQQSDPPAPNPPASPKQ